MKTVTLELNKAQIAVIGAALIRFTEITPLTRHGKIMIDDLIDRCDKEFDLLPNEIMPWQNQQS